MAKRGRPIKARTRAYHIGRAAARQDISMIVSTAELEKKLAALADNIANKALTKAMKKALRPVVAAAKRNASMPAHAGWKKTYAIRDAIVQKVKKYPSGIIFGMVGVDSDYLIGLGRKRFVNGRARDALHWPVKMLHLVELGTKPHAQPRRGKAGVFHPGAKAYPIMRPAQRDLAASTHAIFAEAIDDEIKKLQAAAGK